MSIFTLLKDIATLPGCTIHVPTGQPQVSQPLPGDLQHFYEACGGLHLFTDSPYAVHLVRPDEFRRANPEIMLGLSDEDLEDMRGDISWFWYVIGHASNGQYFTIDLHPDRFGQCYDSFWDRHPTDAVIIARTFTELLERLVANKGQHWYWLHKDFVSLGSPYQ